MGHCRAGFIFGRGRGDRMIRVSVEGSFFASLLVLAMAENVCARKCSRSIFILFLGLRAVIDSVKMVCLGQIQLICQIQLIAIKQNSRDVCMGRCLNDII